MICTERLSAVYFVEKTVFFYLTSLPLPKHCKGKTLWFLAVNSRKAIDSQVQLEFPYHKRLNFFAGKKAR